MALKADGSVWKWGQGSSTPAQVAGLAGITRISAGSVHWMALRTDGAASGTVYAWGTNTDGQIGNGTTITQNTPLPGMSNVIDVSAGGNHSLAAHADGSVSAWGGNARGQLGDGTTGLRKEYPVTVIDLGGVVAVAASETASYPFSVALKGDGSIWSWGNNWYGQVGARGTPSQDAVPQPVYTHPFDGGLGIAAGGAHGLANRYDGQIWGWGANSWGQVGDDSPGVDRFWPVPVDGPFAVDNQWLTGDVDGDGLATWAESANGSDPLNPDSNGDGLLDGAAVKSGHSATNPDMDADGMTNAAEVAAGTDPFLADTDGDGVSDGTDAFPLDPTRSQAPPPVPGDVTPPTITLTEPTNAVLINSVP